MLWSTRFAATTKHRRKVRTLRSHVSETTKLTVLSTVHVSQIIHLHETTEIDARIPDPKTGEPQSVFFRREEQPVVSLFHISHVPPSDER